jgi:20S proteasome alpha/beta subunit
VKAARKLAQQYILTYTDEIPTAQLVQRVANVMQEYTQSGYALTSYKLNPNFVKFVC